MAPDRRALILHAVLLFYLFLSLIIFSKISFSFTLIMICLFINQVPSTVKNITAQAQSPDRIKVWWPPPEQPNGPVDKIVYYVKWSTQYDGILHTTMTDAITYDSINPFNNGEFEVDLEKLLAEQTYSIQVRRLLI